MYFTQTGISWLTRTLSRARALIICGSVAFLGACAGDEDSGRSARRNEFGDGPAPATGAGTPTYPPLEIPHGSPRVAFLGDSISAGLHLTAAEAFPAVLQRNLFERGLAFELINAGISGDTSAGGLARVDWLLKQELDLLVLELGVNDGMRGVEVELIEANLRQIIEKTVAAETSLLLLGMRIQPNYGEEYAEQVAAIYDRLAADFELPYVPFFMKDVGGVVELTLPDGLHPTAEGHRKLATNVEPALADLVEQLD